MSCLKERLEPIIRGSQARRRIEENKTHNETINSRIRSGIHDEKEEKKKKPSPNIQLISS